MTGSCVRRRSAPRSRPFSRILSAALLVGGALVLPARAEAQQWQVTAPVSLARTFAAGDVIAGRLYVVGGQPPTGPATTSVEVYDPATGQWTAGPPAPTSRALASAGAIGGKLYVAGGCINADCNATTGRLEIFDPATGSWSVGPSVPSPRNDTSSAVLDGKLYMIGGTPAAQPYQFAVTTVERFDPVTGVWSAVAPTPTAREIGMAAGVGGKLYVIGGYQRSTGAAVGTVEIYDPLSDTWSTGAPMPTARYIAASAVIGGRIHVVGGANTTEFLKTHEVYDPSTNRWSTQEDLPAATYAAVGAALEGRMLVVSGNTNAGFTRTVWVTQPPVVHAGVDQTVVANLFGVAAASLTASVTGGSAPISYAWSGPGGFTASGAALSVNLGLGVHLFNVTATDAFGQSSSDDVVVSVQVPTVAGPMGPTGATGPAGATGPQGATGATGTRGEDGEIGPAGATGAKGDKGDQGQAGADGAPGPKGDKGDPGATGATGATGPRGAGLVRGSFLFLEEGAPAPAGYTLVGSFHQVVDPPGRGHNFRLKIYVYVKR